MVLVHLLSERRVQRQANASHQDIDIRSRLRAFFDELVNQLYLDPLFRAALSDIVRTCAAQRMPQTLGEILVVLRQIASATRDDYPLSQLTQEVTAYLEWVKALYHRHRLDGIPTDERIIAAPNPGQIFVPLRFTTQPGAAMAQREDGVRQLLDMTLWLGQLGGPGSRKSTLTRYLVWAHATANLPSADAAAPDLPAAALLREAPISFRKAEPIVSVAVRGLSAPGDDRLGQSHQNMAMHERGRRMLGLLPRWPSAAALRRRPLRWRCYR